MANDEGVISCTLRFERIADGLRRAAEFCQRMKMPVGRIKTVDFELNVGPGCLVEISLQPLDIGRLLDRMNETLVPDSGGTGCCGHERSIAQ